ncbi:MAG: ABC transporter ATP-binding protein [Nanoarchaeota archaeon]|nr:ABC transporter ATP-binding protein [Nanoarchaeota archaeon]MBU1322300.1 ABC transporter ATP-binding protein [Nanoarchaeota archaeon]MBU1597839.1 ABC transporter ATP-binding protein [Nanoarchaeota archaeon]MBU2441092.1 ABC transporter ATP-binding protein [Nanoarchaeota archaeon]
MERAPIIKIQHADKSFGKNHVLKNISLDVNEGEIFGLIGASGSGKTTLLKILIGFLSPEQGDVKFRYDYFVKSKNKSQKPLYASVYKQQKLARNLFGFASQEPSFYKKLTVKENMEYFGSLYNLPKQALQSNINILIALMDLKHAENTLAGDLSGGMERRLDIACALVHDPEVLILDEPTSDLDPLLRDHIWSLVKKINKKGTTIILASHHLSEVETFCSRIAIIKNGKIIDVASPARLKTKYADSQEIRIQTYPGSYANIAKVIKKPGNKVFDVKIKGSELIIYSDRPQIVLHELLHTLETLKEELIDIQVFRPGLDELFLKITGKK